ncbi:hypothetical protein ACM25N_12915 [Roseovarius sp. C7]|uniref:hypothetical protein n=1 Tax=Roseovarius sp. C7 TaxID=3398643 RepID=UPI0039F6D269
MARTKICPSCNGHGRISESVHCAYCGASGLVDDGLDHTRNPPGFGGARRRPAGAPLPRSLRLAVWVLGAAAAFITYRIFQPDDLAWLIALLAFLAVALAIKWLHAIATHPLQSALLVALLYGLDHYGNGGAGLRYLAGFFN